MSELYTSPYIRVSYDAATQLLEAEWLGFVNTTQLRSELEGLLTAARGRRIRGYLFNHKKMRTIRPADQEWMATQWFTAFARLGVPRMAIVESDDALNRMGTNHVVQRATCGPAVEVRCFNSATQARLWLGTALNEPGDSEAAGRSTSRA